MRSTSSVVAALVTSLAFWSEAQAQPVPNTTPKGGRVLKVAAYEYLWGYNGVELANTANNQGMYLVTLANTSPPSTVAWQVTLERFATEMGWNPAVIWLDSHSDRDGFDIEVYQDSPAGQAARDASYEQLIEPQGSWWPVWIDKGYRLGIGYTIRLNPYGLATLSNSSDAYFCNLGCLGWYYASVAPGKYYTGYHYQCPINTGDSEHDQLWRDLDGQNGLTRRVLDQAENLLTIRIGAGKDSLMVLSPWVKDIAPSEGTTLTAAQPLVIEFSARMDTSVNPKNIVWVGSPGNGGVVLADLKWANNFTIVGVIHPWIQGWFTLYVDAWETRSDGDRELDGNRDPPNTNGVGPNGDDYRVQYYNEIDDPNAAASFSHAWAHREADGVHVGWVTSVEKGSIRFEVYGGPDGGSLLTSIPATGGRKPRYYEVVVLGSWQQFRVVEIDDQSEHDYSTKPFSLSAGPPSNLTALRLMNDQLVSVQPPAETVLITGSQQASQTLVTDYVFYIPTSHPEFTTAVQPIVDYYQSLGITTQYVYGSNDPNDVKAAMQPIFNAAVAQQYPRLPLGFLVGSAYDELTNSRNVIGTVHYPDSLNDCWWDCVSDGAMFEFDGDLMPDMLWTRIVGTTSTEIANSVKTALYHYTGQGVMPRRAVVVNGNLDNACYDFPEPTAAVAVIDSLYQLKGVTTTVIHERSAFSNCSAWEERRQRFIQELANGFNEYVGVGEFSYNDYLLAGMPQMTYAPVFTMADAMLPKHIFSVLTPGCQLAAEHTVDLQNWPPLIHRFMTADPDVYATAVTWIGHKTGGRRTAHYYTAKRFFERLLTVEQPTYHHAMFNTIREIGEEQPLLRDYLIRIGLYGWPTNPVSGSPTGIGGGPKPPSFNQLDQNYPNPFNPTTMVRYRLKGIAYADLVIYNVRGQRVRTLVSRRLHEARDYEVSWDGTDDRGRPVASGVYFYRLQAGSFVATRKMVLLK